MNLASPAHSQPEVDPTAIRSWCDVVFGYLEGHVPIRCIAEKGTRDQSPWQEFVPVPSLPQRLAELAPRAATEGRAVFVVPGTVARQGSARAEDIVQTGVVVVDLDTGDVAAQRAHLARYLGDPTLEVASGGTTDAGQPKLHLYWRLTEAAAAADLFKVARLREAVAASVGGDRSFRSLHQPIRVAGTLHGKNGLISPVRIVRQNQVEYELGDLAERIADLPRWPGLAAPTKDGLRIETGLQDRKGPSAAELATRPIREGGVDGVTRFEALSTVIGHWLRNVRQGRCTLDAAWAAVAAHNASMIQPPWDEGRLRREFDSLHDLDLLNHGPLPVHAEDQADGVPPAASSEDALASEFVAGQSATWRHVAAWGRWMRWTGQAWEHDETLSVREAVRQVCRGAAALAERPADARRISSEKTISSVLRLASSDPRIATRTSEWDAHPLLLNTPGGVIDLATGEVLPADPARLLSQVTAASPGRGCPRWLAFLDEVTGGDHELQRYLQRLAGYCLTGDTSEQVFAFLHGPGGNGKSVFLDTIARAMGSYAATAAIDTFMETRASRHLTELAGLRAARLVIVSETEVGRGWSEARIKTVTGGESIRANFMHRDHFEFRPQFKLLVAGNHRPALASVGEAMRRRLHLVPFDVTIPPDRRDKTLGSTLLGELDGILGWMLDGCADWQQHGLQPPARVAQAAADYFADEDLIGQWIDECCQLGAGLTATADDLYRSWKVWAETGGFEVGTKKSLGSALKARGLTDGRVRSVRGWHGIGVARSTMQGEDGR